MKLDFSCEQADVRSDGACHPLRRLLKPKPPKTTSKTMIRIIQPVVLTTPPYARMRIGGKYTKGTRLYQGDATFRIAAVPESSDHIESW